MLARREAVAEAFADAAVAAADDSGLPPLATHSPDRLPLRLNSSRTRYVGVTTRAASNGKGRQAHRRVGSFIAKKKGKYIGQGDTAYEAACLLARHVAALEASTPGTGHWTPAEDQLLVASVARAGQPLCWSNVSVPGRSLHACECRWSRLALQGAAPIATVAEELPIATATAAAEPVVDSVAEEEPGPDVLLYSGPVFVVHEETGA